MELKNGEIIVYSAGYMTIFTLCMIYSLLLPHVYTKPTASYKKKRSILLKE
jgi:hypothetical protein